MQVKQLCSVRQTLKVLAAQIVVSVAVEVSLELIRTDFERTQLKYYNFLRVHGDDPQQSTYYDDDDQWLVKYYARYGRGLVQSVGWVGSKIFIITVGWVELGKGLRST